MQIHMNYSIVTITHSIVKGSLFMVLKTNCSSLNNLFGFKLNWMNKELICHK